MNRSKLAMAMILVLGVTLLSAGFTLALFSDFSNGTDANFTAGRLVITSDRDDGDPIPGPMFYVNAEQGATPDGTPGTYPTGVWAPGDSNERTLIVFNKRSDGSTMNAWLNSVKARLHSGSYAPLAEKLNVTISCSKPGRPSSEDHIVAQGPLSQFLDEPVDLRYADGTKVPQYLDSIRYLHFLVTMDKSADNEFQDKTLVVDFSVNAEQMAHNP